MVYLAMESQKRWCPKSNECKKMAPLLEENLAIWHRDKGLTISTVKNCLQAKLFAQQMVIEEFGGGPKWVFYLMQNNRSEIIWWLEKK